MDKLNSLNNRIFKWKIPMNFLLIEHNFLRKPPKNKIFQEDTPTNHLRVDSTQNKNFHFAQKP